MFNISYNSVTNNAMIVFSIIVESPWVLCSLNYYITIQCQLEHNQILSDITALYTNFWLFYILIDVFIYIVEHSYS